MKSAVETLNPTRVKLTVEVPFEELKPSLAQAYKKIAGEVAIPGFRKGKVPPRLIDQRFGRAAVLEEAVNGALPEFYGQAVREHEVAALGQPEVEVTQFADGEQLAFTAEVDVRPQIELPDYTGIQVVVDAVEVDDEAVASQVENLRERFGVLQGVDREAADGDFVSLDLGATVDGEEVDSVSGQSYQIGSETMLDGLDEAVSGLTAGASTTFTTVLAGGEHAGKSADVAVTVKSVKFRELPDLDDEFAQTASEFDTLEELRADVRTRLGRMKRLEQGVQARDKVLEALMAMVDVPLPESIVTAEVEGRMHNLGHQLEQAGLTKEDYLKEEGQTEKEFDAEVRSTARDAITSQFVLDEIATKAEVGVDQQELTEHLVRCAQAVGLSPDQFAEQIVQAGQVQLLVAEVVRGKALALVLAGAQVTDTNGEVVDLEALREPAAPGADDAVESGEDALSSEDPVETAAADEPAGSDEPQA